MRGGLILILTIFFVGLIIKFVQNNYYWLVPVFILVIIFLTLIVFDKGRKAQEDTITRRDRAKRILDPNKLTFPKSDDRAVLYDGRVIGHIVPVKSSIEPWAFVPTHNNGIINYEFRRRAQKDIRAFLHRQLKEVVVRSRSCTHKGFHH